MNAAGDFQCSFYSIPRYSGGGLGRGRLSAAFTLLEMLAVLALTAMLTLAVTLSLIGAARSAQQRDTLERLAAFDRLARDRAARSGKPLRLVFDFTAGRVRRSEANADESSWQDASIELPADARLSRVFVGGEAFTSGEAAAPVSSRGQTPSYGVELATSDGPRWVVFAGLTGHASLAMDGREVEELFASFSPGEAADAP